MAYRHEATKLLKKGHTLYEIVKKLNRTIYAVIDDLQRQAGEGDLKLSEIFFAIPPDKRATLESLIEGNPASDLSSLQKLAGQQGFTWYELDLYHRLRNPRIFRGDMYEYIADIEVALHTLVRTLLVKEFGPAETQWWRQGVPLPIRRDCVQTREEDPDPVDDDFAYTTLIHLAEIIERHWPSLSRILPAPLAKDKKSFLKNLRRLNTIRNAVMHPVKGKSWGREDFEFVRELHRLICA